MIAPVCNKLPPWGIFMFFVLYGYAANIYPGGSQLAANSVGFDWINNYWCDLMTPKVHNGAVNPSYPVAVLAMGILCGSLFLFFIQFANHFVKRHLWKTALKVSGGISMVLALLIATPFHNSMIILSSLFGLIAVLIIIKALFETSLKYHKAIALMCIGLLILNNLLYYSRVGIEHLPLLQKVSFAIILLWIVSLSHHISKGPSSPEK